MQVGAGYLHSTGVCETREPGRCNRMAKIAKRQSVTKNPPEDDGTFIQTANWDVHPLDVVLKSEQIFNIITRQTTDAALLTQQTQNPDATANLENAQNSGVSTHLRQNTPADDAANAHDNGRSNFRQDSDSEERQSHAGGMMRLLAANGLEFCVPREIGALLAELIVKVRSLEELVLDQQRHAASSTHIAEGRTGQNVHIADTYTIHGGEDWLGLPPIPPPARRDGQAG